MNLIQEPIMFLFNYVRHKWLVVHVRILVKTPSSPVDAPLSAVVSIISRLHIL